MVTFIVDVCLLAARRLRLNANAEARATLIYALGGMDGRCWATWWISHAADDARGVGPEGSIWNRRRRADMLTHLRDGVMRRCFASNGPYCLSPFPRSLFISGTDSHSR